MSVRKEASGRRSLEVEVEVPGSPEEVRQAIATGPGISASFVPTELEERDGVPVRVVCRFGPGADSVATITEWDPPRRFARRFRASARARARPARRRRDRRIARRGPTRG